MVRDTFIELRQKLDLAIESGKDEDRLSLRESLEKAIKEIETENPAALLRKGREKNRDLDAMMGVWFQGVMPSGAAGHGQDKGEQVIEMIGDVAAVQDFCLALSRGDLSRPLHVKGAMAGSLKALQANLRHLTWQTRAIARGDFSQRVDFMGDFSESFNHMVASLAEMREALKKERQEIELRVEERTAELSHAYETLRAETEERQRMEEELRQAQKMEALGTLSGGIAHDFNNILAGIIGFTEMVLEQTPADAPTRRKLELILKSGFRGRELVKQILTFSRRAKPDKKELSMSAVIEESLKLLKPILPPRVELRKLFGSARDATLADRGQLHQILMNLCMNAALAMEEKGGVLELGLSDRDLDKETAAGLGVKPGPYIELSVRDTGCGIPKDLMGKIFDPFFTTRKPGQGTGMGLAVVHGIVKGHEGSVEVESEPGKGSLFRVLLPVTGGGRSSEDSTMSREERGKERILFVDDEETLVEMNSVRLGGMGYRVVGQSDPLQALEIFRAEPGAFDLVVTDYAMPSMTGLDLARRLHEIRPHIPVVLCSGFDESLSPKRLDEAGIKVFMAKTANKRELAAAIRKALKP